jgi:hypothetical protein
MHESSSHEEPVHLKERLDDWLDDALADTFPASDPVASPPSGTRMAGRDYGPGPDTASGVPIRGRPDHF